MKHDPSSMRRALDAAVRADFHAFIIWAFQILYPGVPLRDNWHLWLLAEHFEALLRGENRRLLVCMPPRHLKSIIASVCFPAFVLGREPSAKLVCVSYAQNIAEGFAHQTRKLMESAAYKRIFGTRIDPARSSKRDIGTTRNGHRLATSVEGALTALGGDYLIIDDPIKADDALSDTVRTSVNDWYYSTATSRLDNPKTGRIAVIAQRLHVDDLPGQLLQAGGWTPLILPLIAQEQEHYLVRGKPLGRAPGQLLHPGHIGEAEAAELRKLLPAHLYEAQWNQRPVLTGGRIFMLEWLKYDEEPLPLKYFDYILQSWDTAVQTDERNDYTVGLTAGIRGKEIHILDIYRDRIDHPTQINRVREMRQKWSADLVIVEGSHGGIALHQHFCKIDYPAFWLTYEKPKAPKKERAEWQSVKLADGRVFLPRGAGWRQAFEAELAAFPHGSWDDQVDAMTQLLSAVDNPGTKNRMYMAQNSH